jgi:hypothetical protein
MGILLLSDVIPISMNHQDWLRQMPIRGLPDRNTPAASVDDPT